MFVAFSLIRNFKITLARELFTLKTFHKEIMMPIGQCATWKAIMEVVALKQSNCRHGKTKIAVGRLGKIVFFYQTQYLIPTEMPFGLIF